MCWNFGHRDARALMVVAMETMLKSSSTQEGWQMWLCVVAVVECDFL